MDAGQVKQVARAWVETNVRDWPGLIGAHLVGGITSMPDDAPFPASKDIDIHLVFDEGSPSLQASGSFLNVLEVSFGGLLIEAGVKSVAEYASPEAVLANPEITYHLTVDSLLYDPTGWLRDLQEPARREYRRRRWVLARLEHERNELAGALALLLIARGVWGASGELNLLGYTTTYLAAALSVATLRPPKIGGRALVHLRELLAEHGRLDLHDDVLALLGVRDIPRERVNQFLEEGAEVFDVAVQVRKTPHPFQHKLHAHLRPYFVDACRSMIDEGHHREALHWVIAFYCSATDVILVDGPQAERSSFEDRRARLLRELGFDSADARVAKLEQAHKLYDRVFALAAEIVAAHPGIVD